MTDLIYAGNEILEMVKKQFPNAEITDESDFIHEDRFGVDDKTVEQEEWDRWIIKEGLFNVSLVMQLKMMSGQEEDKVEQREYVSRLFREIHGIEIYITKGE